VSSLHVASTKHYSVVRTNPGSFVLSSQSLHDSAWKESRGAILEAHYAVGRHRPAPEGCVRYPKRDRLLLFHYIVSITPVRMTLAHRGARTKCGLTDCRGNSIAKEAAARRRQRQRPSRNLVSGLETGFGSRAAQSSVQVWRGVILDNLLPYCAHAVLDIAPVDAERSRHR